MSSADRGNRHGAGLVDLVIDAVLVEPRLLAPDWTWAGRGHPRPPAPAPTATVDRIAFPDGRPLSPSLRRWLTFDTGLLTQYEWFTPDDSLRLTPRPLHEIVAAEWGEDVWVDCYAPLGDRFPECFLLPGGSDSRRVYAVTEPDEHDEYPVLAIDVDDAPLVCVMYPGFDVYLAETTGLVDVEFNEYTALGDDPAYGTRMRTHGRQLFGGPLCHRWGS